MNKIVFTSLDNIIKNIETFVIKFEIKINKDLKIMNRSEVYLKALLITIQHLSIKQNI